MSSINIAIEADERTVNGENTFTLTNISGHITITNDDSEQDLMYKLNASSGWCTLRARETFSMEFATNEIMVKGNNVQYRVWAIS